MTPYQYVHNNPIMFTDPTGMIANPVYDPEGNHIGNTKEGFTGEILIYSGNKDKSFFENLSADDFLYSTDDDVVGNIFKLDDVINDISDDALSNIFTSVAKKFKEDTEFDMKSVGGKIGYEDGYFNFYSTWITGSGKGNIVGNRNYIEDYESTVENLGLTIINHEGIGHVKKDFGELNNNHNKAYLEVINDSNFKKSTPKFQEYNLRMQADYLKSESEKSKTK